MSTKQQTTGDNSTAFQFDPSSLSAYTRNLSQFLPTAQSWFQNPYGNQMFQQESAIGQDQAANVGSRMKSNILNNAAAMGYSTNTGMINNLLLNAGRNTGNLQAQAFRGAIGSANQRAVQGLGISSAFQPLMTGSKGTFNQTQTTSGLGTWLPQLAGAAAGAAMNAFAPGAGSITNMAGQGGSGLGLGGVSVPSWQGISSGFGGGGVPSGLFAGMGGGVPKGPAYSGYGVM